MSVNAPNKDLGWLAPNFKLLSIDENYYSLKDLAGEKGIVIAFICNHCPYVIKIAERFSNEAKELNKIGVTTVAIMSNDFKSYPEDSFENMKIFAKKYKFDFPYLIDLTQEVAKKYGAVCTPDIYGFNKNLKLQYRGRIDSGVMNNDNKNIKREMFYAMKDISINDMGPKNQSNSFGCSIKWINNNE